MSKMYSSQTNEQKLNSLKSLHNEINVHFSSIRTLNKFKQPAEFRDQLRTLVDKLKHLFSLTAVNQNGKSKTNNGSFVTTNELINHELEFIKSINDNIVDIILYIGESVDNFGKDSTFESFQSTFYLLFSDLVINFAEKSPFNTESLTTNNLNRLVNYKINCLFKLMSQNALSRRENFRNVNEVCRSLGSLIYQNGSKLNEFNLNRMLASNENSNLILKLREKFEREFLNELRNPASSFDEHLFELINRVNLIITQIVFNLTIPTIMTKNTYASTGQSTNEPQPVSYEYFYIEEKFKLKCSQCLLAILRFYYSTTAEEESSSGRIFANNEFRMNKSKILTKALQGLENLFYSIRNSKESSPQQNSALNWTQISSTECQIGDLLALVKEYSFYGLKNLMNANMLKKENEGIEPLEASDIDEYMKKSKTTSEPQASDLDGGINYGNQSNTDEEEPVNSTSNRKKHLKTKGERSNFNSTVANKNQYNTNGSNFTKEKRFTNNNNPGGKNNRQNKSNQISVQVDLNLVDSNINNSTVCFKETQVPLMQFKNSNLNNNENPNESGTAFVMDSDAISTDSSSSTFHMEKCNAKVRIAAVGVLLTTFQTLDKKIIISYWNTFLNSRASLIWLVKHDHSPKVRLIAATALSSYLECVRSFFSIAASESSTQQTITATQHQHQQASFLPISVTIATLIRQLHYDLLTSVCSSETFTLNQIQLFKSLQSLIKATPYHKMKSGLIYKLIVSLNSFLDKTVAGQSFWSRSAQKAPVLIECLNCLEILMLNNSQLVELHLALNANNAQVDSLNSKLEKLTTANPKMPNLTQSRVTYFYESNSTSSFSYRSSVNNSNSASGHITPSLLEQANTKSWLVEFCICHASLDTCQEFSPKCFDLLSIVCRKYFDLLVRDLFFEPMCKLIVDNVNSTTVPASPLVNQLKQKNLKLLEDFGRSLATDELRNMSKIDLNDCCKFWSNVLGSKLVSDYLTDEGRYLLASAACDCLASIGAATFELLPFQKRVYCLTNLLHLTKSASNLIRGASIRALGVYVTFISLKEDQNFLNDLSVCLLNMLANDANNLVRQKTAWSMSNLSEVMLENADKLGKIFTDEFSLKIWLRCLDTVAACCLKESDKIRSYLVRALGNLISYASFIDEQEFRTQFQSNSLDAIERSLNKAVHSLCSCRDVKMLKVKWNLSYSIGVAMRRFDKWTLSVRNANWLLMFSQTLYELFAQSSNFKVRINACNAILTINLNDKSIKSASTDLPLYFKYWSSLMDTFAKLKNENLDANNELQHKNTLEHLLCKMFTYLCKYLRNEDLETLMLKCLNILKMNTLVGNKLDQESKKPSLTLNELKTYLSNYTWEIHEKIDDNKSEVQFYNDALIQLNLLNSSKSSSVEEDCINLLNNLLQKRPVEWLNPATPSEMSENESLDAQQPNDNEFRKQFPFKQVYD